jgi:hypothetical protein
MRQRLPSSSLTSLWSTLADDPELVGLSLVISPSRWTRTTTRAEGDDIHERSYGNAGDPRGSGDPVRGLAAFDSLSAVPQVDPSQARPEATLDQHGTPVVRLELTGQDDTPAWRAIYNEIAAKDDCPAEIDGPQGAAVLLVYLTDISTDAAISSVLDRAGFEHLHKVNTCIFLRAARSTHFTRLEGSPRETPSERHAGHRLESSRVVASRAGGSRRSRPVPFCRPTRSYPIGGIHSDSEVTRMSRRVGTIVTRHRGKPHGREISSRCG